MYSPIMEVTYVIEGNNRIVLISVKEFSTEDRIRKECEAFINNCLEIDTISKVKITNIRLFS